MLTTLFEDWPEAFQKADQLDEATILKRVRRTQIWFFIGFGLGVLIVAAGLFMLVGASGSRQDEASMVGMMGVLLVLMGLIEAGVMKLTTRIQLLMLWTIWQERRRQDGEMRRSLAEDL